MAIDVYSLPTEQSVYVKQNLFQNPTQQNANSSIGVNIYQDFAYTQLNNESYLGMTTGASVVLNHWVDFGLFCSYYFPQISPIHANNAENSTMFLKTYLFCGNTLAFTVLPEKIVHPRFALDFGFGHASGSFINQTVQRVDYPIFILRPAVIMDMNLFSFFQWTLGIRYRFQMSFYGPEGAAKLNSKASWLEISTGPVFNIR